MLSRSVIIRKQTVSEQGRFPSPVLRGPAHLLIEVEGVRESQEGERENPPT